MTRIPFGSRATVSTVAVVGFLVSCFAHQSIAETLSQTAKDQENQKPKETESSDSTQFETLAENEVAEPQRFSATAYTLRGKTASGRPVAKGLIAADRRVLPLGSRVRLEAGSYSGVYTVADTGAKVRGKKVDIWMPSNREARRFGRRPIKLTVLAYGKRPGRAKVKNYLVKN